MSWFPLPLSSPILWFGPQWVNSSRLPHPSILRTQLAPWDPFSSLNPTVLCGHCVSIRRHITTALCVACLSPCILEASWTATCEPLNLNHLATCHKSGSVSGAISRLSGLIGAQIHMDGGIDRQDYGATWPSSLLRGHWSMAVNPCCVEFIYFWKYKRYISLD